jgi:ribokinase
MTRAAPPVVLVVGSCMIDMVSYVPRLPRAGETLIGGRFAMGFGGKGANQAVMASRLGARVSLVGCVGTDSFGSATLANLAENGIDTTWMHGVDGVSTGVAPIWVEPDGTNRIVCTAGANDLVPADRAAAAVSDLAPAVVVGQLEVPQPATRAAFEAARGVGALTVLNPAPAAPLDAGLLAATDWLVPNESELSELTGRAATDDAALLTAAASWRCPAVVTLGGQGAAVVEGGTVHRVPAPRVDAVDTTGAGDAFVGAFAVGLAHGLVACTATELAITCASASVGRPGTQTSFPRAADAAHVLAAVLGSRQATGASSPPCR